MSRIPEMPDLVLLKLFSFLGTVPRFRARLVCKRWRFLVDQVKQTNLCLYGSSFPRENELSPNRQFEVLPSEMVWINTNDGNETNFNLETTFFRRLERLFLYCTGRPASLIFRINRLERLKELGIMYICIIDISNIFACLKLELKNLEILSIKRTYFNNLELNTPQLSTLVLCEGCGDRRVKVLFPEKVTFLQCEDFPIDLKQFVNLEILLTRKVAVNLGDHPKLKVLDLRDQERGLWENLREQASGRKDLTICSFGFRNIFFPHLTSEPVRMFESFLSEHYRLLELPISFGIELDYDELLSSFGGRIPKSLFNKLTNIHVIQVKHTQRKPENYLDLIRLLKESKCYILTLGSEMPQTFYDLLPDCYLKILSISHYFYQLNPPPNNLKLDFLPKLTRLCSLKLNLNLEKLPFDLICETIQRCKFLENFNLTNKLFDKQKLEVEIAFESDFKSNKTKMFKVNGETLQNTTKEEVVRYLKERNFVQAVQSSNFQFESFEPFTLYDQVKRNNKRIKKN